MRACFASLLFVVACTGGSSDAPVEPEQHLPAPSTPKFTLWISNQSFDLSQVDIRVSLDTQLAVSGDFLVGSQHTWLPFELDLSPGVHTLTVASKDSDATLTKTFDMDDRKYGVVSFWYAEGGSEPVTERFTWNVSDEPFAFD
jgi:hypothetical protein